MENWFLDLLHSPCCRDRLTWRAAGSGPLEGSLECARCGRNVPVRNGIPRFVGEALKPAERQTQSAFAFQWRRYPADLREEEEADFLADTQIPPGEWRGKTVLDAGCGMGRYARIAAGWGARVVGVDLSEAADRAALLVPEARFVQASLLDLPFRPESFDIVYSVGVLHHTSDPREALLKIARLAKRGGTVTAWFYGTAGRYGDFVSNPVRTGRSFLRKAPLLWWTIVKSRETLSDLLRFVTVRLPKRFLWGLCVVLAGIGKLPILKYLTYSVHPDWRVRTQQNFDWLSPFHQSHHTKEEVLGWFREAGLSSLTMAPHGMIPKVAVRSLR